MGRSAPLSAALKIAFFSSPTTISTRWGIAKIIYKFIVIRAWRGLPIGVVVRIAGLAAGSRALASPMMAGKREAKWPSVPIPIIAISGKWPSCQSWNRRNSCQSQEKDSPARSVYRRSTNLDPTIIFKDVIVSWHIFLRDLYNYATSTIDTELVKILVRTRRSNTLFEKTIINSIYKCIWWVFHSF